MNRKYNRRELVNILKEYFTKNRDILHSFIFGSYAMGSPQKTSDLDIAVYFADDKILLGLDLLFFINKLSELTGRDVDLVILNKRNPFLRHQIMKYNIPVIIKDTEHFFRFREKIMTDYDEYKYVSGMDIYD